jgi:hypothetical protein
MKPQTRRSGLLIRELPDEVLVYDRERHHAHCLNRTAALVFRRADGTRTVREIARELDPQGGPEAEAAVSLALDQLREAGLLEDAVPSTAAAEGMSRREVARRVGIAAAILLPAVATIVAPTPAEAAATCVSSCAGQPNGTPCSCFGANPCTSSCVTGVCNPDNIC